MHLLETMKVALHHKQCPMTAPQLAYFLCTNNLVQADDLQTLVKQVEGEALFNPAHFSVTGDLIFISAWQDQERCIVQTIFDKARLAVEKCAGELLPICSKNTIVLALLLYKRLSDIKRSQQNGAPIVPLELKFDYVLSNTALAHLPGRLFEVMDYIERTDNRLCGVFQQGIEGLCSINQMSQVDSLYKVMHVISTLKLDEESVPTPLFQAAFSRLFLTSLICTSGDLGKI